MDLMQGTDISWRYIIHPSDIPQLISNIKGKTRLAVDTETYALSSIYKDKASALDPHTSRIRLIQLNWDNNYCPFVIDVLKIGVEELKPFIEVLANPSILKVFHNASFDIKQFKSTFGSWLENVHCTKVLMQTLGISVGLKGSQMRGHSLVSLARDYFDQHLDKTESISDWSTFNLSKEQLEYSALDVGAPLNSGMDSIVLQGYDVIKDSVCNSLDETAAFIVDQEAMYTAARCEYSGMYIDTNWLSIIAEQARKEMESSRFRLCSALGFPLEQELTFNPDTGEFEHSTIVPDKIATLLNSNKVLVNHINAVLGKTLGKKLTSLQAAELETTLKEIETEKEDSEDDEPFPSLEDIESESSDYADYGISLIKDLLTYKKFSKLLSEAKKYTGIINPVTNRVHAGFNPIGASTGRMSSSGDLNLQQVSSGSFVVEVPQDLI